MFARNSMARSDDLESLTNRLSLRMLERFPESTRHWWGDPSSLEGDVRAHVRGLLDKCFDHEIASKLHSRCPIPGTYFQDYLSRLLTAPDGREALVAIRFMGLNSALPFIELETTSFALTLRDLEQLKATLIATYRRFQPKWMRVFVSASDAEDSRLDELPWEHDVKVLAGVAAELAKRPVPKTLATIDVRRWSRNHQRYAREAEEYLAAQPNRERLAEALDDTTLAELARAGDVVEAFDSQGNWIGLGAMCPEPLFGAPGTAMYEEIVASAFRRKGYGAAIQRALIDRLPRERVLWGHIHGQNTASLCTARKMGRIELGEYRLYELMPA